MGYELISYYSYQDNDINDYIEAIISLEIARKKIIPISRVTYQFASTSAYFTITPPIDNFSTNLELWQNVFNQVFAETKLPAIIICPCRIDNDWVAIFIELENEEQKTPIVKIYNPTHNQAVLNKASALLAKIIPEQSKIKELYAIESTIKYDSKNSGVIVAEYLAQIISSHPSQPDIRENAELIRKRHVAQMAEETQPVCNGQWHYTSTNFLARNTTLTRSIVLNKFLEICDQLQPGLDYSDTAFILLQHLIPQTPELIKALIHCKANPKYIYLLGKLYSTGPCTLSLLQEMPINLIETIAGDYAGYPPFGERILADILRLLTKFYAEICTEPQKIRRVVIMDDGGKVITSFMMNNATMASTTADSPAMVLTQELHFELQKICQEILQYCEYKKIRIAAAEQTSAGCDLESGALVSEIGSYKTLPFPVVMMASSVVKDLLEPVLISRQLWDKLQGVIFGDVTNIHHDQGPIRIGIIGGGKIGQAVVWKIINYIEFYKLSNVEISIYDTSPNVKIPDRAYCRLIPDLPYFINISHFIIGCTGRDTFADIFTNDPTLRDQIIAQINEPKVFISSSSENKEFYALIKWANDNHLIINPSQNPLANIQAKFNNHEVEFLYGGCPFNFSGYSPAVYFQDIQSTLCMLFGAILQAYYATQDDVIATATEGRGIAKLLIYDPFIQQTIIKLSTENVESLYKIFNSEQQNVTENLNKNLQSLQEKLEYLALAEENIVTKSMYSYSQERMYSRSTDTIFLGTIWQYSQATTQFRVENFAGLCQKWLEALKKHSKPNSSNTDQQLVPAHRPPTSVYSSSYLQTQGLFAPHDAKQLVTNANLQFPDPKFFITLKINQNIAHDIPDVIAKIADPEHHDNDRFYFMKTSSFTVRSYIEIGPHMTKIIDDIKKHAQSFADYSPDTVVFLADIGRRVCSFYYSMGCIEQAVSFANYTDELIEFAKNISPILLTPSQQQQLNDFELAMKHIHWFNIYLLMHEYDAYQISLPKSNNKAKEIRMTIDDKKGLLERLMDEVNANSSCWKLARLAAWRAVHRKIPEAIATYHDAISKIDTEIANGAHDSYKRERANMQLELAELYLKNHQPQEAKELLNEIERFYKKYTQGTLDGDGINLDEALRIWKLGKLQASIGKIQEAKISLCISLAILKALKLEYIGSIFVSQVQIDLKNLALNYRNEHRALPDPNAQHDPDVTTKTELSSSNSPL